MVTKAKRRFKKGQIVYEVYSNNPGHWALRKCRLGKQALSFRVPGYWHCGGILVHETNFLTEAEAKESRLVGKMALPWNGMIVRLSE